MADGSKAGRRFLWQQTGTLTGMEVNDVRALRLAEIIQDFRNLQHYIAQIRAVPTEEEYHADGYVLLRQCLAEGRAILAAPFSPSASSPNGNPESEKKHLQYVILDASARRFQAQGIYLRATAAMRWINSRNAILDGARPSAAHQSRLNAVQQTLNNELAGITDDRILSNLRTTDQQSGKWIGEDPSLNQIRQWIASRR